MTRVIRPGRSDKAALAIGDDCSGGDARPQVRCVMLKGGG